MSTLRIPGAEIAHDLLHPRRPMLEPFFAPRSVAVIGASEAPGSVGRTLLWNLISNPFGGTVYPINLRRSSVLGIRAYPTIAEVPGPVDLAIVATPADTVPAVIGGCVDAGVPTAIIISAGFRECGPTGAALETAILEQARRGAMRIIGPNCLGLMSPITGLNATFARSMARSGPVAFVSQSGALCTAILDWSEREQVGFSAFVSVGTMLDVGWGDLIDHLGNDPRTRSILLYMESIGDARAFLSAARQVALTKPIIVLKAGRSQAGMRAAASHTGSLASSDAVLDAAFERCGVLRVDTIADLFSMAEVLAKQPRPSGRRLTILTNAGGPAVLATDALVAAGGELAPLAPETIAALDAHLPAHWSHANPIDILGDASPDRYAATVSIAAADPTSDGLLVILTPQDMTEPTQSAERLASVSLPPHRPLLASWMGGVAIAAGEQVLNRAAIPTFADPETAARAFVAMWRYNEHLRSLYETPSWPEAPGDRPPDRALVTAQIAAAREQGRTLLTEVEAKTILAAYGLPTVDTVVATSPTAAVEAAERFGYPVVLKLLSTTITHKSDVGGVHLNLGTASAVRRAYRSIERSVTRAVGPNQMAGVTVQPMIDTHDGLELIVGSIADPQVGPVILFGAGGLLVEIIRDRALALPPLTTTLARRLMEHTQISRALAGVRGRPAVDLAALERLLVRLGQLVVEQPQISEIDINPLIARPAGDARPSILALDARIVLHKPSIDPASLPPPAIRPYPQQYVRAWQLSDGGEVIIRPIRPEDEPLMVAFHATLSETSVYRRYFAPLPLSQRVAHERLIRICFVDYDRELALVAEQRDPSTGQRRILAAGRLSRIPARREAEFSLLVSDPFQGRGLGTELLSQLIAIGQSEGLEQITGDILSENQLMLAICRQLGFRLAIQPGTGIVRATITLPVPTGPVASPLSPVQPTTLDVQ